MAVSRQCYCTREDVKNAPDFKESARANAQIDRAIQTAAEVIEGNTNRVFYPTVATRVFNWPDPQRPYPWRLWLNQNELISVSVLSAGGVVIPSNQFFLEPANSGPPYTRIELNRGTSAAFSAGSTPQHAISVTGVFGYRADTAPAGTITAALTDTTGTAVSVSSGTGHGVGSSILIDSERMLVTDRTMTDTTVAFTALSASAADNVIGVPDGTKFGIGEVLLLDSERMLVTDIPGNSLVVKRAWDGTILTVHTSGTIWAQRLLTVTRGALGTTAATHPISAPVARHTPPNLIRDLAIAEAVNQVMQETSGYALIVGEGDTARPAGGAGLAELWAEAVTTFARKVRQRVI